MTCLSIQHGATCQQADAVLRFCFASWQEVLHASVEPCVDELERPQCWQYFHLPLSQATVCLAFFLTIPLQPSSRDPQKAIQGTMKNIQETMRICWLVGSPSTQKLRTNLYAPCCFHSFVCPGEPGSAGLLFSTVLGIRVWVANVEDGPFQCLGHAGAMIMSNDMFLLFFVNFCRNLGHLDLKLVEEKVLCRWLTRTNQKPRWHLQHQWPLPIRRLKEAWYHSRRWSWWQPLLVVWGTPWSHQLL